MQGKSVKQQEGNGGEQPVSELHQPQQTVREAAEAPLSFIVNFVAQLQASQVRSCISSHSKAPSKEHILTNKHKAVCRGPSDYILLPVPHNENNVTASTGGEDTMVLL